MTPTIDKGMRHNNGKLRYDLIPQFALQEFVKVLTKGAEKYEDRNWELGMRWSKVVASLKRHLAAFEKGIDYDEESGVLHTAHIMSNAAFLTEYYRIYPQGDDRQHMYLKIPKIGLDVDEVLADWVGHWCDYQKIDRPNNWNFDRRLEEKFNELKDNKDFWLSIPVKTNPDNIHFEPSCYITSRPIPTEWTEEWLDNNGFPAMPVYTVPFQESKVDAIKESGVEVFVDDNFKNFVEINKAGVCCYLFDAPHNRRYNVGHKRIQSLNDIFFKL